MSKKGQTTIITVFFLYLVAFALWFGVFGEIFSTQGQVAIENGATGMEAFFWSHLNLWFGLILVISLILLAFLGAG